MKLVVEERESAALAAYLDQVHEQDERTLVSSLLLHVELHCAANRRPSDIPREAVDATLSGLDLSDVERQDLLSAPSLPGKLRSADAIHLATAIRLEASAMVVYDAELQAAAQAAGLQVLSPAQSGAP